MTFESITSDVPFDIFWPASPDELMRISVAEFLDDVVNRDVGVRRDEDGLASVRKFVSGFGDNLSFSGARWTNDE